ncbi:MAG: hypothetical protein ACR2PY_01180, partial [Salinispira sp.]
SGDTLPQTVAISHHPEVMDVIPPQKRVWLDREPEQFTRIIKVENDTNMTVSQLFARGLLP